MPCGQDVVDGGGEGMLGGQAIFREQHPHPAGPSQPGGQLTVAAKRPEFVTFAVQEEEHPAGVRSRGGQPVGRHPADGHFRHQHVLRHRMKAAPGSEGGAALFQRWRGLAGTGLPLIPEVVNRVLHCLARHVGRGYRPELSSATISAADCGFLARATPCPAHIDSASMSPVVPTIGGAGSYRTIASPEAKCAITSPSPGRWLSGGRPAASHALAVELGSARWGESGHPTSYRLGYHCGSVSAAAISRRR